MKRMAIVLILAGGCVTPQEALRVAFPVAEKGGQRSAVRSGPETDPFAPLRAYAIGRFDSLMQGPDREPQVFGWRPADCDGDGDVDLVDWAATQQQRGGG